MRDTIRLEFEVSFDGIIADDDCALIASISRQTADWLSIGRPDFFTQQVHTEVLRDM